MAFKDVLDIENYNELEMLRKKPDPKNKAEQQQLSATQRTNIDMPLSVEKFESTLRAFGYPAESKLVYDYLKGVGEYDHGTRQTYFTIRDIYNYHNMMSKGQHDKAFEYRQFLFKCISSNGQEITKDDIEDAVIDLNLKEFRNKNFERAIQITEGSEHAHTIKFQNFEDKLHLLATKSGKRGANMDARSDAQTIYQYADDDGKSKKSKKSSKSKPS